MNWTLYKREMKKSWKLLLIFATVLTMYISIIINMYDPEMMKMLDGFETIMPEVMAAVGMSSGANNLIGFMVSYLYGFILLIFPMLFSILRGNGLVSQYVDRGSMTSLMAAPVKRKEIAITQMTVLISGIFTLVVYSTVLELVCAQILFPGELQVAQLLRLNLGLLCLQLFIGSICFTASCAFSETGRSIGFGAGIPALMYIIQMLANVGGKAENAKYFTFFSLFSPENIVKGDGCAILGIIILFLAAVAMYVGGIMIFDRKDLYI